MKSHKNLILVTALAFMTLYSVIATVSYLNYTETYKYTSTNLTRAYKMGCAIGYNFREVDTGSAESFCGRMSEKFDGAINTKGFK